MSNISEPILHIPESVKEDTLGYRSQVKKFLDGQASLLAFRAYRVPMGVYEQRAAGKYMVRVRIGAGLTTTYQLERIAELSKTYGNGIVHVTTRQDIQIHEVDIEDTPEVLEGLLEVGLSPRGGGGNTIRNVTACPRAGVCPKEEFDVAPYAIATAEYLLQDKSSFNLPRKYKIVFSGCSQDCAFASVADLGFFAHANNGVKGFSVYAAGGLGSNPAVAAKIEDFIEAKDVFEVAEAIKRLFDKYGDRENKRKARLRYVLARVGVEEFIKLYQKERERLKADGLPYEPPKIRNLTPVYKTLEASNNDAKKQANVLPEKTTGRYTVRLWLRNGDIPAEDLNRVGQIAAEYGQGIVRTTQMQDIFITSVVQEDIDKVKSELKNLSIDVFGDGGPKVVACAGASTCKLGLCLSRGLSDAISNKFSKTDSSANLSEMVIGISGCPNSCGHHYIADLGLQGRAKRVNGKLMPCYDVLAGATTVEGNAHLAERIGTVPAKKIPELLAKAFEAGEAKKEKLKKLVEQCSDIPSVQFPEDYYYDFGSDKPFSLAGRGPGECGAGVMDVIKLDIDQAKDAMHSMACAIKSAPVNAQHGLRHNENVYKAIVAAARALLVTFGLEPKKDREIFTAFSKHLIEPGWVKPQTQQLLDDAIDWCLGDKESIDDLLPQVGDLTKRVEELFLSLDANLKFKAEPFARQDNSPATRIGGQGETDDKGFIIDLRGIECPLNFVKAKLELEKISIGQVLEVLLDDGEPVRNAPASFAEQGQEVLEVKNRGNHFCVRVRRKK